MSTDVIESYGFDRFLRYGELVEWIEALATGHPDLVTVETYGTSHEGRALLVVTVTDASTGTHDTKPAHWVDASIHAVELTATVAACFLLRRLVDGFRAGDETVVRALRTRTFYVVPRVNPDGAEWALADQPRFRRSSVRPWPDPDAHRWPGLHREDVDGDGRILQKRLPDPHGPWRLHPDDARVLIPVPPTGTAPSTPRYRVLDEGTIEDFDGFAVPSPPDPEGLDLNRNYPAGWGTEVGGSGDHPLSEPEIDALVRAVVARPNVCGFNAFHTSGGALLRPSSTRSDADLPPVDVWAWKELGAIGTDLTGYAAHSVFDDYTWDRTVTMSGASDDWAYEHLGIYGWTTEFWDVVRAATGERQSTHFWYTGPTDDQRLAVARWLDEHSDDQRPGFVDWYPFDHPQLGPVELGGFDVLHSWTNPPVSLLRTEVEPHADFAIAQALCAPSLSIEHVDLVPVGDDTWRVTVGVANTGWLPTTVTDHARRRDIVPPIEAEIVGAAGSSIEVADGPARRTLGQLGGSSSVRIGRGTDGTPDRATCSWLVTGAAGSAVVVRVGHRRAGSATVSVVLDRGDQP